MRGRAIKRGDAEKADVVRTIASERLQLRDTLYWLAVVDTRMEIDSLESNREE